MLSSLLDQALEALSTPELIDPEAILEGLFPLQQEVILSEGKRKCLSKSRRAGATYAIIRYLLYSAIKHPGTTQLYLGITRDIAKVLIWQDLKELNAKHGLKGVPNESELRMYFPNGSIIWASGANKTRDAEKFRGPAYKLVVLDECASFDKSVEYLIQEVLSAALKDYNGTVLLAGTPGRLQQGLFYEATVGEKKENYKQFFWTVLQNPEFPLWADEEDWEELAANHLKEWAEEEYAGEDDPAFQREYRGLWVLQSSDLLFSGFSKLKNVVSELPSKFDYSVMAVDLGFNDACGFLDISWNADSPMAYIHNCFTKPGMDFTAMAEIIKARTKLTNYKKIVIDSAAGGKTLAEELRKRHQISCEAAEKQQKAAHIELINTDLLRGYLVALEGEEVISQLKGVQWNEDRTREAEGQVCDLIDCLCYSYRSASPYFYREKKELTDQEKMLEARLKSVRMKEAAQNKRRRRGR